MTAIEIINCIVNFDWQLYLKLMTDSYIKAHNYVIETESILFRQDKPRFILSAHCPSLEVTHGQLVILYQRMK